MRCGAASPPAVRTADRPRQAPGRTVALRRAAEPETSKVRAAEVRAEGRVLAPVEERRGGRRAVAPGRAWGWGRTSGANRPLRRRLRIGRRTGHLCVVRTYVRVSHGRASPKSLPAPEKKSVEKARYPQLRMIQLSQPFTPAGKTTPLFWQEDDVCDPVQSCSELVDFLVEEFSSTIDVVPSLSIAAAEQPIPPSTGSTTNVRRAPSIGDSGPPAPGVVDRADAARRARSRPRCAPVTYSLAAAIAVGHVVRRGPGRSRCADASVQPVPWVCRLSCRGAAQFQCRSCRR